MLSATARVDWPAAAAALARLVPRERLEPAVDAWVRAKLPRKTAVAFSGGADSLALLLLVWAHFPEVRRGLHALHFDHRLRGAASQADVLFCRQVCRSLRVPSTVGRWHKAPPDPSEAMAREARMAFFRREARIVWLGHQQDDIAETLLMRLGRGSGAGGLSAPRPVQVFADERVHLRPLLPLRKSEIEARLRELALPWREDVTNAGDRFLRGRIRREILPRWEKALGRDAVAGAARSRRLLEEDDNALESWLAELDPLDPGGLVRNALVGRPRALWRRALHVWLRRDAPGVDLSSQAFEALLGAAERGRPTRQSLGDNLFAVIDPERLRVEKRVSVRRKIQRRIN